jgi:hypothetical protein
MRNLRIFTYAVLAGLALFAVAASPAFAESEGEVLLSGAKLTESIEASTTDEFLLEDTGAPGVPELLCSLKYDERITFEAGEAKLSFVLTILTLEGIANGNMVDCEDMKGVCKNPVLMTATLLPWHWEYSLINGTSPMLYRGFYLTGEPANVGDSWDVDCETLLGKVEDVCEEPIEATVTSEASGILDEFSQEGGKCSVGGENKDLMVGSGLTTAVGGGTLSISE